MSLGEFVRDLHGPSAKVRVSAGRIFDRVLRLANMSGAKLTSGRFRFRALGQEAEVSIDRQGRRILNLRLEKMSPQTG